MVLFFYKNANAIGLVESRTGTEAIEGIHSEDDTKVSDVYNQHPEIHPQLEAFCKDPLKAVLDCKALLWNLIIMDYPTNNYYYKDYQAPSSDQ